MGRGVAFVLLDGIGDVNIPELARMTPLQAAHTPCLDAIAGKLSVKSSIATLGRVEAALAQFRLMLPCIGVMQMHTRPQFQYLKMELLKKGTEDLSVSGVTRFFVTSTMSALISSSRVMALSAYTRCLTTCISEQAVWIWLAHMLCSSRSEWARGSRWTWPGLWQRHSTPLHFWLWPPIVSLSHRGRAFIGWLLPFRSSTRQFVSICTFWRLQTTRSIWAQQAQSQTFKYVFIKLKGHERFALWRLPRGVVPFSCPGDTILQILQRPRCIREHGCWSSHAARRHCFQVKLCNNCREWHSNQETCRSKIWGGGAAAVPSSEWSASLNIYRKAVPSQCRHCMPYGLESVGMKGQYLIATFSLQLASMSLLWLQIC